MLRMNLSVQPRFRSFRASLAAVLGNVWRLGRGSRAKLSPAGQHQADIAADLPEARPWARAINSHDLERPMLQSIRRRR